MGADFVIQYACRPKEVLGKGDQEAGGARLVELLNARSLADLFERTAREQGQDVHSLSMRKQVRHVVTGEVTEKDVTYRDLLEQTQALEPLAPDCASCPMNALADAFGCRGRMRYPIPARTEEWLMNRLQPAGAAGGFSCLKAIKDLGYTGEPMERWREGKLFELAQPLERSLDPKRPEQTRVNSNQIWHALLALGPDLNPWHCGMILLWFGAIRYRGAIPTGPDDLKALTRLEKKERHERTAPEIGPPDEDYDIRALQGLLYACYLCWLEDLPLYVDA